MRFLSRPLSRCALVVLSCVALVVWLWASGPPKAHAIDLNDWETLGSLPGPRSYHATTVVGGVTYLVGGESADCVFEDTMLQSTIPKAPMPLGPRSRLGAATVLNEVYAIGGSVGCGPAQQVLARNEQYDIFTDTWRTRASMLEARHNFAISSMSGSIYVFGGNGSDGSCLQTAERYVPSLDKWFSIEPLPEPYCDDGGTHAAGGIIIRGRLNTPLIYNPMADSWTTGPPIPRDRDGFDVGVGPGIVVVGGTDYTPSVAPATSILVFSAGSWSEISAPAGLSPRRGLRVSVSPDYDGQAPNDLTYGRMIAWGGMDASLASTTRYTTIEGTKLPGGNTPTPTPTGNNDGDGIPAGIDNCPYQGNGLQTNSDWGPIPNGTMVPGDDQSRSTENLRRGYTIGPVGSGYPGDACDRDDDNDGLLDGDEASGVLCAGATTTPTELDSDGDHLADWYECDTGGDPNDPLSKTPGPAGGDADNDRIPDNWELRGYHHVPNSSNTDNDNCADLVEIASVDDNFAITDADRLAVARRALNIWPPDPEQDYVLDISKNGMVGDEDRLFVARAALLPDWVPKSCT